MKQKLVVHGRLLTSRDLPLIRPLINKYFRQGQTFISRELCRHWNCCQPDGALNDMPCRQPLPYLGQKGLITLPSGKRPIKTGETILYRPHETYPMRGELPGSTGDSYLSQVH